MVVKNLRAKKSDGKLVIWTKPATGDQMVPYNFPDANLTVVDFSTTWDYFQPPTGFPKDVAITHVAVAADTGTSSADPPGVTGNFSVVSYIVIVNTDYVLATHSLGYIPRFKVSVNGVQYPAGCPVQVGGSGSRRSICFWADTTKIYVRDSSRPGPSGLPAITLTYHVAVFETLNPTGQPLMDVKITSTVKRIILGYGRIDTNKPAPMREPNTGETTYNLPTAQTMDIRNGRARFGLPDGSQFDIGPSIGMNTYEGSFFGAASKKVTV